MSTTNDVTTVRAEVTDALPEWQKVRDAVAGEKAVKAKEETYLPKPNPADTSDENDKRYDQYLERASFFNATAHTESGLVGIAFNKEPELELPPGLEDLEDDTDGAGGGLYNQSHRTLESVLETGRAGLLADFPTAGPVISKAAQKSQNLHPLVIQYASENVINWRTGKDKKLTLVVLYDPIDVEDGYGTTVQERWRELRLVGEEGESKVYIQRLWVRLEQGTEPVLESEYTPMDSEGKPFSEIPFTFIGAIDNNAEIDKAPLQDLANLNISHYRCSADYFESAYFCGQPTFWAAGLSQQWVEDVLDPKTFYVGCRAIVPLPEGGSFGIAQAQPNTMAAEAMGKLENQMVAVGARLLMPGGAPKTAEESRADTAAAHSVLSLATRNVSNAYTQALKWACAFSGDNPDEASYSIPTDFVGLQVNPQLLTALVQSWQSGAFPKPELYAALRQLGLIAPDRTDEDLDEELDQEGDGLDLDTPPTSPVPPGQTGDVMPPGQEPPPPGAE